MLQGSQGVAQATSHEWQCVTRQQCITGYTSLKGKQFLSCSSSCHASRILYVALAQPAEGAKDLMSILKLNNL